MHLKYQLLLKRWWRDVGIDFSAHNLNLLLHRRGVASLQRWSSCRWIPLRIILLFMLSRLGLVMTGLWTSDRNSTTRTYQHVVVGFWTQNLLLWLHKYWRRISAIILLLAHLRYSFSTEYFTGKKHLMSIFGHADLLLQVSLDLYISRKASSGFASCSIATSRHLGLSLALPRPYLNPHHHLPSIWSLLGLQMKWGWWRHVGPPALLGIVFYLIVRPSDSPSSFA